MTYRPITRGDEKRVKIDPGARPAFAWLPLDKLLIDDDFQRPLARANWSAIRKIAQRFNWAEFGCVDVAPVGGGRYSVIDGQHRCHAALLAGIAEVPCLIKPLDQQQQARAFAAINSQVTAISTFHVYRAALAAMDPWAITAQQCVAAAGCELMTYHPTASAKKPKQVYTVGLIRQHVEAGRGALVTTGLSALANAPYADTVNLWSDRFIRPWLRVLQDSPRALRRDLTQFVSSHDLIKTGRAVDRLLTTEKYRDQRRAKLFTATLAAQLNKWVATGGGQ